MSDLAELYQVVRKQVQNTNMPQIKKVMNTLDTANDTWIDKMSNLSAETNDGNEEKFIEAMKEAAIAMDNYEKVLRSVVSDLAVWGDLFRQWSRPEGPAPGPGDSF